MTNNQTTTTEQKQSRFYSILDINKQNTLCKDKSFAVVEHLYIPRKMLETYKKIMNKEYLKVKQLSLWE